MPAIKKRFTLPEGVIDHLFKGEVSGNSFAGLHSEEEKSIAGGTVEVFNGWPQGQMERRNAGKTYWANVKVKIGDKWYGPGMCSFFPLRTAAGASRWTKANIILWIEQALTCHVDKTRNTRDAWANNPRMIRKTDTGAMLSKIVVNKVPCTVKYQDGVIATIYPVVPAK